MTERQRINAESQRKMPDREKVVVEDEFHKLWTDEQAKIVRENAARIKQMTEESREKRDKEVCGMTEGKVIKLTADEITETHGDTVFQFVTKALETQDEFIFETIRPFCETQAHMAITKDELIRALTLLREQKQPGWISVKDRLPENRSMCLTYSPKGKMRVAEAFLPNPDDYPSDCWWSVHGQGGHHYVAVTHWMPLPEPPEEVSGND